MKKRYIPYVAVLLAASANAQTPVFHEGFDAEQTKQPTEAAWYEYINHLTNANGTDAWTIDKSGEQAEGDGCLKIANVDPEFAEGEDMGKYDQFWQRAVKFRNLPLQEGKSYRLTWRLKGANTWFNGTEDKKSRMFVSLMQGGENADIPLLDAQGNEFRYEVSYLNPDEYEKYTRMFHFASAQLQKDTYAKQHPDKDPLADTFFATFNVVNPGEYFLDEIDLVESPIAGVKYGNEAICIDFGFATNIADLANNSPIGVVIMPEGCVKLTINGEEADIETVELHKDGKMYIYPTDGVGEDAEIKVTFENPTDEAYQVKYQGTLAPEGAVPSFTDEAGTDFDEEIDQESSYLYFEPSFISATPAEGSFGLENVTEVSFTFDRVMDVKAGTMKCILDGSEQLVLKTTEDSETLTFERADKSAFPKGMLQITLEGVKSAVAIPSYETFTLSFEVGQVQVAETTYELAGSALFPEAADGSIPEGWTVYSDGELRESGTTWGSGGRVFSTVAPQGKGIYTRANGDAGSIQSPVVAIPAGDIEIRSYLAYWSNPSDIQVDVCDEAGNVVATKTVTPSVAGETNRNNSGFQFEVCPITFNTKGGNFYVKYTLLTAGFNGMFVGGYDVYTYKQSAGESTETQIVFEDNSFGAVENNGAPKPGSGWRMYDLEDNTEKGYFNNGESWGYGHSRFWTGKGFKNLSSLFYTRNGGWPNHFITYGEIIESEPDEPTLELAEGRHQFTYYALNWKGGPLEYHFQIIDEETKEIVKEVITTVAEVAGGSHDYKGDTHKIQFVYSVPKAGKYSIKYGGTGESFSGPVTIEKLGSQAAYQLGIVNAARALAEAELANCLDTKYDGATKTALQELITKYANPGAILHTPAEVDAARIELEAATKAMEIRRDNIDRYASALTAVENGVLAAMETKYEKLEQFPIAQEAYNKYLAIEPQTLDDAELIDAVAVMSNTGALLENMVNTCVPLLTQQMADLSAAIIALDEEAFADETVIAADEAISDDQALVKNLKKIYAAKLYAKIAAGDPIVEIPEDYDEEEPANRPVSFLIQNSKFYSTTVIPDDKPNEASSVDDFPGWTIVTSGRIQPLWDKGWGQQGPSAVRPVYDCAVCAPWGDTAYSVEQLISDLPVAKYMVSLVIAADAIAADNPPVLKAYVTVGENTTEIQWEGYTDADGNVKYERGNNTPIKFMDVVPAVDGNLASLTLGADMKVACFGKVDDANLYIVDKAEGFDYAAAAKALEDDIKVGIEAAGAPEGEPVSVSYFNANGVQVATPEGVTIKIARYANGCVTVTKFIAK